MLFWPDMKTCFLFPGQGSQYPGMAKDLWEKSDLVKDLFTKASIASGMDTKKLLFESTAEELKATDKTQVAITLASLCSSAWLQEKGVTVDGCAGFSLGEYAALCVAGVVRLEDVFAIVKVRGDIMEKAARELSGAPGMAAVMGLAPDRAGEVVRGLQGADVFVSNENSPTQVVISGTAEGVAQAELALKAAGAKRLVRLQVSGPFHSPLMAAARGAFDAALKEFAFCNPRLPVYSNVTGQVIQSGEEARRLCAEQLVSGVRWMAVEESLLADGFDRFLEAGPGKVLTGLFRALRPEVSCAPAGSVSDVEKVLGGAA